MTPHVPLWLLAALLTAPSQASPQDAAPKAATAAPLYRIDAQTPRGLQDLLQYTGEPLPLVSAHRGGAAKGFPENCIATFQNTLRHTFAILEVDPRYTRDGAIVLHHDARLERTTTGQGLVAESTLEALKRLRLKDPDGAVTEFQIPTLDEALEWARGKAILILDQKDVPSAARVKKIEEHEAEAYAMLIVYSFQDARAVHARNQNVMMEVMVSNAVQAAAFEKTSVPWRNVVAFVGHDPPREPKLYNWIHGKGARCLVGTSRNLDQQVVRGDVPHIKRLEPDYRALLASGADLIETDVPAQLGPLLYGKTPVPSGKKPYFHVP